MKKIFSRIIVMVLLLAMIVPFVKTPKVDAATDECGEGETAERHINYYFLAFCFLSSSKIEAKSSS